MEVLAENTQSGSIDAAFRQGHCERVHLNRLARRLIRFPVGGFVLLGCMGFSSIFALRARAQGPNEYQVKAAFLYNFAKFVEWPEEANDPLNLPEHANDPIKLCIVGDDPFRSILDEMVKGKTIGGRAMEIKRIKAAEGLRDCKIAFISASERRHARSILESLQGARILTVGESRDFAREGGIINFILEDNKLHFEINVDAAQRAHLKISSKLLSLAKIIKD